MFKLSRIAALDIAERRVRVDDSFVTKVFESHQVLALVQTI